MARDEESYDDEEASYDDEEEQDEYDEDEDEQDEYDDDEEEEDEDEEDSEEDVKIKPIKPNSKPNNAKPTPVPSSSISKLKLAAEDQAKSSGLPLGN
jgi:hypothetical protein